MSSQQDNSGRPARGRFIKFGRGVFLTNERVGRAWPDVAPTCSSRTNPPEDPESMAHAIEVLHELEGRMSGPLELRHEPEHYVLPRRARSRR